MGVKESRHAAVVLVVVVLFLLLVASARAASSNPYIPQDTVKRMEMNYGLPLALPGWLPSGYRFKGWVAVPQHSLILGFVREGRLVWFMLSGRAGCRTSTVARPFVIPRGSAYRRCVAGAGTVTVWSLDEAPGGLRAVAARTVLSWKGRD